MRVNVTVEIEKGGSRGIGAAITIQLASIEMDVVINYAWNEDAANEV
jgi:hypothetical protein